MGPYCRFCNQRCFVHFPNATPQNILDAYGTSNIIATCSQGQAFEKKKVGFCYDDINRAITDAEAAQSKRQIEHKFYHPQDQEK